MMLQAANKSVADFAYVRFMGERDLTRFDAVQRNQDSNLKLWHEVLSLLNKQTFVYFSNFYEGHAPASANKLKRFFGQSIVTPETLENQPSLF
jgi:uncharacterized protein YecE (DUF72 family)